MRDALEWLLVAILAVVPFALVGWGLGAIEGLL